VEKKMGVFLWVLKKYGHPQVGLGAQNQKLASGGDNRPASLDFLKSGILLLFCPNG